MYLTLYGSTHLQTLCELMDIAKKHDCRINIVVSEGHNLNGGDSIEGFDTLLEQGIITKSVYNDIIKCFDITNSLSTLDTVCFELIEHRKDDNYTYNKLIYATYRVKFRLKRDLWSEDEAKKTTLKWLEEHCCEWDEDEFYFDGSYHKILGGFKNIKPMTHVNIYREGMAMRAFSDLVCDYLHEPRIERTY